MDGPSLPLPASGQCASPQPLHPDFVRLQRQLDAMGLSPGDPLTMTLAEARAASERYYAYFNAEPPEVQSISEVDIPGPAGAIAVRVYASHPGVPSPTLIYFHGGGFTLNSIDTHDRLLRLLAIHGRANVCAVGYSLAPEKRFPHQLEEALAVVHWLSEQGWTVGVDPEQIVLGGDSAGANLALSAALALRDRGSSPVGRLLLFYGAFAAEFDTGSHRSYGDGGYGLTTARMRWFWNSYLAEATDRQNPLAAPLNACLRGLPPVLIIAASCDCLLDDSLRLGELLHDAGVPHVLSVYQGFPHAFMQFTRVFPAAMDAVEEAGAILRAYGSPAGQGLE